MASKKSVDFDHSYLEIVLPVKEESQVQSYSENEKSGEYNKEKDSSLNPCLINDQELILEIQKNDGHGIENPSSQETLVMNQQNHHVEEKVETLAKFELMDDYGEGIQRNTATFDQFVSSASLVFHGSSMYQCSFPRMSAEHKENYTNCIDSKSTSLLEEHSPSLEEFDNFSCTSKLPQGKALVNLENNFDMDFESKFKPTFKDQVPFSNSSSQSFISPFILKDKTSMKKFCPQCKSKYGEDRELKNFQVSLDSFILLCSSDKCTYPYDTPKGVLDIQTHPADEVMLSEIDFDINNIPVNMDIIDAQLSNQQNCIIQPFLNSFDKLKHDFEVLKTGEFKVNVNTDDAVENNANLMHVINEALAMNEENYVQYQNVDPKEEYTTNPKKEIEDIDAFIEEQNKEIELLMLNHFV